MGTPNVLEDRVAGAKTDFPRHPRVEPVSVASLLRNMPSAAPCADVGTPVSDALTLLDTLCLDALAVMDEGRLAGIFSVQAFARASARLGGKALAMPLRDLMQPSTFSVRPTEPLQQCLSLMREHRLHVLPVLEDGRLLGLVTLEDVLGEAVAYCERVFKASALDEQILFLRGTYSC